MKKKNALPVLLACCFLLMLDTSAGIKERLFDINGYLDSFYPLEKEAAYTITVCADLPDNENPERIHKKREPGHVFLILVKSDANGPVVRSFGFYPVRPVSSIVFKNVRSEIRDNGNREYNAYLSMNISAAQFETILKNCRLLSAKKYNLNRYNCYDYVVGVFNSLPGVKKLPVTHVKFPFIFGRGGSPCGLYKDLQRLCSDSAAWSASIRFGVFTSPISSSIEHKK
jgi:hypothetical protein